MASHSRDRPVANSQLDADALSTFRSVLLAALDSSGRTRPTRTLRPCTSCPPRRN